MEIALKQKTKLDKVVKQWLLDHPYDPTILPKGWEIRFGMRGRFMKYDSIEHAERKNKVVIRETGEEKPFGYVNHTWETLKSNLLPDDEIWIHGGDGGVCVFLIRNGQIINDTCGKYQYPRNGYHVILSSY